MTSPRRTAVALAAVASLALAGGTLASFSDKDTSTAQILTAGTVAVDAVEGAGWATNLSNLAVGDTFTKTATLENTSTLDIGRITLSADLTDTPGEFGGNLSEAVTVDITQQAAGALPGTALASDVPLADLADGYDLNFAGGELPAGTDLDLSFAYEVTGARPGVLGDRTRGHRETPGNPDNPYQGSSLRIAYTIDAIQRDAADLTEIKPVSNVTVTGSEDTATVTFDEPANQPEGTTYRTYANEDPSKYAEGTSSPLTVTGLASGVSYTFTVVSVGPRGTSTPVPAMGTVTPPATQGRIAYLGPTMYPTTPGFSDIISIDTSAYNTGYAVRVNNRAISWGSTDNGKSNVANYYNVVQAVPGPSHGIVRYKNGTVTAFGYQASQSPAPGGLSNIVEVDAYAFGSIVRSSTGAVTVWGTTYSGALNHVTDAVDISAYDRSLVAVRANGTVVTAGVTPTVPAGLSNVVQAETGGEHVVALRADGTVVAWGDNTYGETNVPAGLTNVVEVAAGTDHSVALRADGTVVAWGRNNFNQVSGVSAYSGVFDIAASGYMTIMLRP